MVTDVVNSGKLHPELGGGNGKKQARLNGRTSQRLGNWLRAVAVEMTVRVNTEGLAERLLKKQLDPQISSQPYTGGQVPLPYWSIRLEVSSLERLKLKTSGLGDTRHPTKTHAC